MNFYILKSYAIIEYSFVVMTICGRKGKFVDSDIVGRMENGHKKLPGLKKIYCEDLWKKNILHFLSCTCCV